MKSLKALFISITAAVIFGFLSSIAWAIPSAELTYTETALGVSLWQYEYTVFNTSDPVEDAGYDLYDMFFTFDSEATFTILQIPDYWDGWGDMGFAETFSYAPGTPPEESLDGFIFQFDQQVGDLYFEALLTNPDDPFNPVVYSGTATPIPEPCTIFVFLFGLMGIVGLKKMA
jgi:hypothetical protein